MKPKVSATIITLDAERTLARALAALEWVDEIVVVDSGSGDATLEIARAHGARCFVREWPGYGVQKARAAREARGEWILSVDADEVVSEELARSIRSAVSDPGDRAGFEMACHTRFLGAWLGERGWWTDWKLRLFHRDRGRFTEEPVHEGVRVDGPVGRLAGPLRHHPWESVAQRMEKDNRYGTLAALRDYRNGRRATALSPVARGLGWLVKEYLLRGGFLHGRAGAVHAALSGAYAFQRAAKLWELERRGGAQPPATDHPREDR